MAQQWTERGSCGLVERRKTQLHSAGEARVDRGLHTVGKRELAVIMIINVVIYINIYI